MCRICRRCPLSAGGVERLQGSAGKEDEGMAGTKRKQQIEAMLADEPNDPFLHYGLGMEYVGEGNLEQALGCFREAFRVDPDYVPAYQQAGQALVRLGRPADARTIWQQGIAVAGRKGNRHAADEMQGMLADLAEG
jgi:uncharacterized protein HemY